MKPTSTPTSIVHRQQIAGMFTRIAPYYDLLNDILSFGLHRAARNRFMRLFDPPEGALILDICAGTGVLSRMAAARGVRVVMLDAAPGMLAVARRRGTRAAMVVGDALELPFADDCFDAAMVGFGLRSMASLERMFGEARRVVRPGGLVGCLDFTQPRGFVRPLFRTYLRLAVPAIGSFVDRRAYNFLARSVERVIDADGVAEIMHLVGLRDVEVHKLAMGTIACWLARA